MNQVLPNYVYFGSTLIPLQKPAIYLNIKWLILKYGKIMLVQK